MVVTPVVILGCFLSQVIMRFYGESFGSGWSTLVPVLLTAGLFAVQVPVGQIITASGWMWTGFIMNTGWAIAFLGLSYALVKNGSIGIASARLGAYMLHATWTFGFAYWYLKAGKKDFCTNSV